MIHPMKRRDFMTDDKGQGFRMKSPPTPPPIALTIAGSDSCGGAGIQADLKTFTVLGVYGASVITAITAQNTIGVQAAEAVSVAMVRQQLDSVADDLTINAVKTGMLGSVAVIDAVAEGLTRYNLRPVVVDPVMIAKSGDPLIDDRAVTRMSERLLPLAAVTTPNRHEAARLLGMDRPVTNLAEAGDAARQVCERFGPGACVIKAIRRRDSGHEQVVDVLYDAATGQAHHLTADWQTTRRNHGSGCAFSAAIAAGLATGRPLADAVEDARRFISRAIAEAPPIGHGIPPVSPLAYLSSSGSRHEA